MEKRIAVDTTSGTVVFSHEDTTIHMHDNSMVDYISKVVGYRDGQIITTNYPLGSLGRHTLQLSDLMVEIGFPIECHGKDDQEIGEQVAMTHFSREVELAEIALEGWINGKA